MNFGKVRYKFNDDYVWAFDVAVVKLDFDFVNSAVKKFEPAGPKHARVPNKSQLIFSGGLDDAKVGDAGATIAQVFGEHRYSVKGEVVLADFAAPERTIAGNNVAFGIKHIQWGIVQTLGFKKFNLVDSAKKESLSKSLLDKKPLEGRTFLDQDNADFKSGDGLFRADGDIRPVLRDDESGAWYVAGDSTVKGVTTQKTYMKLSEMLDAAGKLDPAKTKITFGDYPIANILQGYEGLPADEIAAIAAKTERINLKWNFDVFISARSVDNGTVEKQFNKFGRAKWYFDGSGELSFDGALFTWTPDDGAGVTVDEVEKEKFIKDPDRVALPSDIAGTPPEQIANKHFQGN